MDFKKLFNEAQKQGINELSITVRYNNSFSIELLNQNIDKYEGKEVQHYSFKGKYNKKIGNYSSEHYFEKHNQMIIKTIIESASLKDDEEEVIFSNDQKKVSYIKEEAKLNLEQKILEMKQYYSKLSEYSPLIKDVLIWFTYTYSKIRIINSLGLEKEESNHCFTNYINISVTKDNDVKNDYYHSSGINDQNILEESYKLADRVIKKLKPVNLQNGKYKVILEPKVVADIFNTFMPALSGDSVQKERSIFKDKLNQRIASTKLTLIENPTDLNRPNKRLFDNDGINTYQKELITDGKLKMFLYDAQSAAKGKTKSTGNAFEKANYINVYIKPLVKDELELLKIVDNGILVTGVHSLHSGANLISGSISLKSSGYLIRNGEVKEALDYFVLNTDFSSLLQNIEEIGSNLAESGNFRSPSIVISKVDITS